MRHKYPLFPKGWMPICATLLSFLAPFFAYSQCIVSSVSLVSEPTCYLVENGSATVVIDSGTPPYTYGWDNNELTATATMLNVGFHYVTISDADNCVKLDSIIIPGPSELMLSLDTPLGESCGYCEGTIVATVAGGTPPYTYSWPNNQNVLNDLCPGTYTMTVTDANDCLVTGQVTLEDDLHVLLSHTVIPPTASNCDASIDLSVDSNYPPFNYSWSTGDNSEDLTGLCAGTYFVTVEDAANCISVDTITVIGPLEVNIGVILGESCAYCEGVLNASPYGGVAPYTYEWSNNETTATISDLCPDSYVVTVTDASGTAVTAERTWVENFYILANHSSTAPSCGGCDATIDLEIISNAPPFSFAWANGATTEDLSNLCPGTYQVTITDSNGCTTTESITIGSCVWPGDANYDGYADNLDIISLGFAFGQAGPQRPNASLAWVGQAAEEWSGFNNGVNNKHSDCDGNGLVNYADTLAVALNYGQPAHPLFAKPAFKADAPPLYFEFNTDTISGGDTLTIDIMYGTASQNATPIYGLAFTVTYDPTFIKTGAGRTDFSDSWVGTGSEIIYIGKEFEGYTDLGIARTDLVDVDGFGKIASMSLVIQDNIDGLQLLNNNLNFYFADVTVTNTQGHPQEYSAVPSEIPVINSTNTLPFLPENAVQVFPNPAQNWLQIDAGNQAIESLVIYNVLGVIVLEKRDIKVKQFQVDVKQLPLGSYFIKVRTKEGEANKVLILGE